MLKMENCLALIAVAQLAYANDKHPIRQEIVDEIKLKATSWKPMEVEKNHMRHHSAAEIKGSMGHLGTSPASAGADIFKSVSKNALDMFKQMTASMGVSS